MRDAGTPQGATCTINPAERRRREKKRRLQKEGAFVRTMRCARITRREPGDLVGDVHGVVDVLKILELFELVDETHDLLRVGDRNGRGVVATMIISALRLDALLLERAP